MRFKAGIIGVVLWGGALSAHAFTSPYTAMAVPSTNNNWSPVGNMVLVADNTWVCTQNFIYATGDFKFAANNGWVINWGGNASIARVPAVASASTPSGANIGYSGFSNGNYRITFNDATHEFHVEWAGALPLPLPQITNLALVGTFNNWVPTANGMLTNHPAPDTNIWSLSIDLYQDTAFQFYLNDSWDNQFGGPESTAIDLPDLNSPVTNSACGKSNFTLSDLVPGTFRFVLDIGNALFTVTQTATNSTGPLASVSAVGNFVSGAPPDVNLEKISSSSWRSDFNVTNSTSFRLSFIGRDTNGVVMRYWGVTNSAPLALPATGSMLSSASNVYTNATIAAAPGNYRITFDANSGAFSVQQRYTTANTLNYLLNPSFESVTEGSPDSWGLYHATSGDQSSFGAHSGTRCGVLMAKINPGDDDLGNFDQTNAMLNGLSGQTFRVSASFRTMGVWTAETVRIIVEWKNGTNVVDEDSTELVGLSDAWQTFALETPVPSDSIAAKVLFKYDGVPGNGFLLIDDAEARIAASRFQDFNGWGSISSFQRINPDWEATSGKTLYNIPGASPIGGILISKYIEGSDNNKAIEIFNGTASAADLAAGQYVLQQYNNGAAAPSVNIPLSGTISAGETLVVSRLGTPTNAYPPDPAILSAGFNHLQTNLATFNGDDVVILRQGGTNGPIVDRVGQIGTNASGSIWARFATDHSLHRKHSVLWGVTNHPTNAYSLADWTINAKDDFSELGIHFLALDDPNAPFIPSGYSLLLNTNASLMTPELDGGIGDISFYARAQGALAGPDIQIAIESSTSQTSTNWTLIATNAIPLATTNFTLFATYATVPTHSVLRIRHIGDGTTNRIRIDDVSVAEAYAIRRTENFAGWTNYLGAPIGTYSMAEWTIRNAQIGTNANYGSLSAILNPDTGSVTSPTFEGGVGTVKFWLSQYPPERGEVLASVLTSTNGWTTWVTNGTVALPTPGGTNVLSTNAAISIYLPASSAARISANGSPSPFVVDNVEVRIPLISRILDFDDFKTSSSYSSYDKDGWLLTKTAITTNLVFASLSGLLQNGSITSPYIDEIGAVTFYYKMGPYSGDSTARLTVEISANGSAWTTLGSGIAPAADATMYAYLNTNANYHYFRITQTTKDKRMLIDQIEIGAPVAVPSCTISAALSPVAPAVEEDFYVTAEVVARNGADILSVTGAYAFASNGPWTSLAMAATNPGSYRSGLLDGLPAGTQVFFKASVRYGGIGAVPGSSSYTTNVAYSATNSVVISSVPRGTVWINEIFYSAYTNEYDFWEDIFFEDHEFVELCGVAGTSLAGWQVQLLFCSASNILQNGGALYASYAIPDGTVLSNTASGYGFYVVGDSALQASNPVDQVLTTLVPTNIVRDNPGARDHIHDPAGIIRILDNYSNVVYSLSYGAYDSGSEKIPSQGPVDNVHSLSLSGTGAVYAAFTWNDDGDLTIGAPNTGQAFQDEDTPPMAAWHAPAAIADTALQGVFCHFEPIAAAQSDTLYIHYAYTNAAFNYGVIDGRVHHHKQGSAGEWNIATKQVDFPGNYDTNGIAYLRTTITNYTYDRLDTLEYVVEAIPNKSGWTTAFLGSDGAGSSTNYATLAEAQEHPFEYTFPIADDIVITKFTMALSNTVLRFETDGNDTLDPIDHFNVRYATNLLAPRDAWGTLVVQSIALTNEQNYITAVRLTNSVKYFYAIEPLWP